MVLKHTHDSVDEIPEEFRSLYSEKNGKWECTGISGMRTQADIDRLNESLRREREITAGYKDKLKLFGGGDLGVDKSLEDWQARHDEWSQKLDRIPELEAAAKDKLDEAQIEEIVQRRVDGTVRSRTSPLERQISRLTQENEALKTDNTKFVAADRKRTIHDAMRQALRKEKTLPEAEADALLLAEHVFEVTEDGAVLTREGAGCNAGLDPVSLLNELRETRGHWWAPSQGTGSRGSGGGGSFSGGRNPWSSDGWNVTAQGQYLREHGTEKAEAAARSAGTSVGGTRPQTTTK